MSRFVARRYASGLQFSAFSGLTTAAERLQPRDDPRCGWQSNGATCDFDPLSPCCSQYGYCGNTSDFCQISQGCQSGCLNSTPPSNGRCGSAYNGALCQEGCCSKNGYCGSTDEYCLVDNGCQSGCTDGGNSTITSTNTTESLSSGAKIGMITGSVLGSLLLVALALFLFMRCRKRKRKLFDADSDLASVADSFPNSILESLPNMVQVTVPIPNPATLVCTGCSETKPVESEFPRRRVTEGCNHEPRFCLRCLERRINISLAGQGWNHIICPENGCGRQLRLADVQEFARADDFQRYVARRRRTETRECQICFGDKLVATEFPLRPVTDRCTHEPACKECIIRTIRAAIDEGRWANIVCPLCPNRLEFKDIDEFAADEDFQRYDRLETRRAMERIPNFRWCLREGCESGQIHDVGEQLMICDACGYEMCYIHERPWHAGLTCAEYEDQHERRLRVEEAAVRNTIRRTTRPCPNCNNNIEKVPNTCNHMTCRPPVGCGHEFCYECLVRWRGYGRATTHRRNCSSYIN